MTKTEGKETKKTLSLSRPGKLELNKTVDAGQGARAFQKTTYKWDKLVAGGGGGDSARAKDASMERSRDRRGGRRGRPSGQEKPGAALELARLADAEAAEQQARRRGCQARGGGNRRASRKPANAARAGSAPEPETCRNRNPTTPKPVARATKSSRTKRRRRQRRSIQKASTRRQAEQAGAAGEPRRRQVLTIADALDDRERTRSVSADRRRREKEKRNCDRPWARTRRPRSLRRGRPEVTAGTRQLDGRTGRSPRP